MDEMFDFMVWRSRFAGLTEMDRITVVLGPVLAWAWADCLATSVVPPCRTHRNVVLEKLLAWCTIIFFLPQHSFSTAHPELSREPTLQHLIRS